MEVARVKRELLAARVTCPLCHKFLRDATTISECLHTFCKKCIFEKFTDEEVDCCPVCNTKLGCAPVEKLRPDHNLQDVRAKIFPFKRRKVNAPEVSSISLPARRKERSLSSLVVSTPRVATQNGQTGKRTKPVARKDAALRVLSKSVVDEVIKKEEASVDVHAESSSSPEIASKIAQNRRQNSSNAESANQMPITYMESGESCKSQAELWKPLNCLVEAVYRTKALKFSPQSLSMKEEKINCIDSDVHIPKTTVRNHASKSGVQDDKNLNVPTLPKLAKTKRLHGISRKRKQLGTSAQALLDASGDKHERRTTSIWFSLVAAADQDRDVALPQLSASYLRIKDGTVTASFIKKYLVKKLDLACETEVDIICRGELVDPRMPLNRLVEMWMQTGSSHQSHASVGSSAKDFVMSLTYRRRVPAL